MRLRTLFYLKSISRGGGRSQRPSRSRTIGSLKSTTSRVFRPSLSSTATERKWENWATSKAGRLLSLPSWKNYRKADHSGSPAPTELIRVRGFERSLHRFRQLRAREWFWKRAAKTIGEKFRQGRLIGVAAANDGVDFRIHRAQALDRRDAAHSAAHGGVEDHRLEVFAAAQSPFVKFHRLESVRHRRHFVTERAEKLRGQCPDRGFVIHSEDAWMIEMERAGRTSRFGRRDPAIAGPQIKGKGRTFRRRILQQQKAAVFFHDRITDRQAQPSAGRFRGEIWIENLRPQLVGNSRTAIRDRDLDVMSGRKNRAGIIFEHDVARADADRPAVRHRFARVQHQRVDHLLDLTGVDFRFPKIDRDIEIRAQVRSVKRELG